MTYIAVPTPVTADQLLDLLPLHAGRPPVLPATAQHHCPPADEVHLPTANTCISRLYLPMYSSKQLLRTKLLQAITTKVFGFV